jgi:hypothetical protein
MQCEKSRFDRRKGAQMKQSYRFSKVSRRVWNDAGFRALSHAQPNGQTLWFRLLTGPELTSIPGVVMAWEAGLAQALRWDLDGFRHAMSEVKTHGLAIPDWESGLIWIPNAIRHNPPQSINVILGWKPAWDLVPECKLKVQAYHALKAFVDGMSKGFRDAFKDAIGLPCVIQEQEQEQEKEEEIPRGPLAEVATEPKSDVRLVAAATVERPAGGRLPESLVAFEREQWVAAYQRGVEIARGLDEPWTFPRKAINALRSVVEAYCVGDARKNIPVWIEHDVTEFVRAVAALDEKPALWSQYGPDGLQRWHNAARPGRSESTNGRRNESAYVLDERARRDASFEEARANAVPPPIGLAELVAKAGRPLSIKWELSAQDRESERKRQLDEAMAFDATTGKVT